MYIQNNYFFCKTPSNCHEVIRDMVRELNLLLHGVFKITGTRMAENDIVMI